MNITLAQLATVLGLIATLFAAGRAWESHEQRIRALEQKQDFLHGTWELKGR